MSVIEQMLQKYPLATQEEKTHALREIMQEVALAGLYRAGFFEKAAFYGGTCLRIFHGLPRFSEDLDFSLLNSVPGFRLAPYLAGLQDEFEALGFSIEIVEKVKSTESAIVSAFLKNNSSVYDLNIAGQKVLKIKLEVDTDPPLGFVTEEKLLLQPYSFYVKCFSLPDLFAGKMHAVLFRQWKNRVKGRDWFDFEWYVRRSIPLHLGHFCERARQSADWDEADMTARQFMQLLHERIATLDVDSARDDVQRFVRNPQALAIWSRDYFLQLAGMLTYTALPLPHMG